MDVAKPAISAMTPPPTTSKGSFSPNHLFQRHQNAFHIADIFVCFVATEDKLCELDSMSSEVRVYFVVNYSNATSKWLVDIVQKIIARIQYITRNLDCGCNRCAHNCLDCARIFGSPM